jgi:transcriptional regulator with XRE-family HTH domain
MSELAENLRRLRKQAKLTQAQLAKHAHLPRQTLAHMEQPESNPSVQSVVAVARALGVSVDELLTAIPEQRHYKVQPKDMQEYRAESGRFVARLVSPIVSKGVQMHFVTMQPGCRSAGRPHPLGAQEFFYTLHGTATVVIEDEAVEVPAGCLVQFPGHRRHLYANAGEEAAQALSVVVFRLT